MTPDEKDEVLHRLRQGETLEPLLRQRINQLVEDVITDDRISVNRFRLLLMLSGAKLTDIFVMDHDHAKAVAVRSTKRNATATDHKREIHDRVRTKHRVVHLDKATADTHTDGEDNDNSNDNSNGDVVATKKKSKKARSKVHNTENSRSAREKKKLRSRSKKNSGGATIDEKVNDIIDLEKNDDVMKKLVDELKIGEGYEGNTTEEWLDAMQKKYNDKFPEAIDLLMGTYNKRNEQEKSKKKEEKIRKKIEAEREKNEEAARKKKEEAARRKKEAEREKNEKDNTPTKNKSSAGDSSNQDSDSPQPIQEILNALSTIKDAVTTTQQPPNGGNTPNNNTGNSNNGSNNNNDDNNDGNNNNDGNDSNDNILDSFTWQNLRRNLTWTNLDKFGGVLGALSVLFVFLFRNTFIWRPLGVKYFGKNAELHSELYKYYLERHTDTLIRRGYTLEKLYDISDKPGRVKRLANKLHFKRSGSYGDELDRFHRMLNNEPLEAYERDDDEGGDEYAVVRHHTRKSRESHRGRHTNTTRTSRELHFSWSDVVSTVGTMTVRLTVPVLMAYFVACSAMASDKLTPKAYSRFGNMEFHRLYSNPSHCKTLSARDVKHDTTPKPYNGQLQHLDTEMDNVFETHTNVDKLRYALLTLYPERTNWTSRRVLPLHLLRTDGSVRESANEMAEAVKKLWEKQNMVGITRSGLRAKYSHTKKTLFGRRRNRGGASLYTMRTQQHGR